MENPVIIVDYNPQWPALYAEEREQILGAVGDIIAAIEHVGSTSVPGLGAKPIIDIMVGLHSLADAQKCMGPLAAIGYQYRPELEEFIPERRYFNKGPVEAHRHLHMVEVTSDFWKKHLLFRDTLRTHADVAEEYERLKRDLAARFGTDRTGYTDAKTSFIEAVIAKARAAKEAQVPDA